MSKLLENKQIVHIATEIVVLIGITFYFSSKNKKLLGHIEDLSQRLEDQEDMIQKHEQIIKQLVQVINNKSPGPKSAHVSPKHNQPSQQQRHSPSNRKHRRHRSEEHKRESTQKSHKKHLSPPPQHIYEDDEQVYEKINDEVSSEDDSELDAEIAEELNELNELKGNSSLKKEE